MKQKIFLIISTFASLIVLSLFFSIYLIQKSNIKSLSTEKLVEKKEERINYFNDFIDHRKTVLKSIIENHDFKKFIEFNINKTVVNNLFLTYAHSHKEIFQFRYINSEGKEVIRIDNEKEANLISLNKLQNKKNRYYFKDTMKLKKDEIFYSLIDLNMEHGKIQQPIIPTLRIASPIFSKGVKKGIVIININLNNFLMNLQKTSLYNVNLVYEDGHIIISKNKKYNWSRDFKLKERIFDIYPSLSPNKNLDSEILNKEFLLQKLPIKTSNDIYILLQPKEFKKYQQLESEMLDIIHFLIFITLLVLPGGYFIASYISRMYEQRIVFEEIKSDNILINSIINSTKDLIFYKDKEFRYIGCNKAFKDFVSKPYHEIIGKSDFELFNEKDAVLFRKMDKKIFLKKETQTNTEWVEYDNSKVYLQTQKIPFIYNSSKDIGILGISRDITELYNIQMKLKEQTYIDELTQVLNRKSYNEEIKKKLDLFKRYNIEFCLLMLDIDNFKNINDKYGHDVGDKVLIKLSKEIKYRLRKTDIFFRVGGEEFVIIYPKTKLYNAYMVSEEIRIIVSRMNLIENRPVTISCGLTESRKNDTKSSIYKRADEYLYFSKHNGKNMITKDI